MSDVPSDLLREILLRLPAEPLLRFRAVCKQWLSIIDDPSFIKSHTHYSNNSNTCSTLLLRDSIYCRLYLLSLDGLHHIPEAIDLTRIRTLVCSGVPLLRELPANSCHGLILISHHNFTKSWALWNPLTREYRRLSEPDLMDVSFTGVGLGYDSVSEDYKVVKIDQLLDLDGKIVFQTLVYSLKSGSWKVIKDRIGPLILLRRNGVYLNGALHWISENVIMILDLGSEVYRFLLLPPLSRATALGIPLDMCIDAMDGSLFLTCYYSSEGFLNFDDDDFGIEECLEGWVMEDDGNWIKCFSFKEEGYSVAVMRDLVPVAFLKSKGYVFLQNDDQFYWVDVHKNIRKKLTIHGLPESFTCQDFRASLIRLHEDEDDKVGGRAGGVSRKVIKKRAQTRFKLSVTFDLCDDGSSSFFIDGDGGGDDHDDY